MDDKSYGDFGECLLVIGLVLFISKQRSDCVESSIEKYRVSWVCQKNPRQRGAPFNSYSASECWHAIWWILNPRTAVWHWGAPALTTWAAPFSPATGSSQAVQKRQYWPLQCHGAQLESSKGVGMTAPFQLWPSSPRNLNLVQGYPSRRPTCILGIP